MLAASNLRYRYGANPILSDVSLSVSPGEVLAIIGPNGAGKSTLLHLLSGTAKPQGGDVSLDGRPLRQWKPVDLAKRRAVLPQAPLLNFPFRVLDVVMLGRSPFAGQAAHHEDLRIAAAALRSADAVHLAERIYPTLSGGERQRVQLARVLAQVWPADCDMADEAPGKHESRYLLLDEPTNNLDIAHQQATLAAARRLTGDGHGVLAVLHDPNLAAFHADRVCILKDGEIMVEGTPDSVITEHNLEAAFGLRVVVMRHPENGRAVMVPG